MNQMRLLGEDFPDSRVVEKVLVSLPEKFEHKICFLEDLKDCVKELLLQFLKRRVELIIFTGTIKKEKDKKRKVAIK